MKGINLANKLNQIFSFHAGFYLDPRPKNLGKIIEGPKLFLKQNLTKILFKYQKVNKILKKKIKIFIENNVITKKP